MVLECADCGFKSPQGSEFCGSCGNETEFGKRERARRARQHERNLRVKKATFVYSRALLRTVKKMRSPREQKMRSPREQRGSSRAGLGKGFRELLVLYLKVVGVVMLILLLIESL